MYFLLSDHLGSTSLTTDAGGNVISELRYTAWGSIRYASGTTPTQYTYTGQYSNVSEFGLMYYNARWYDPALGRFAQADAIVPGGVQGYDRYAYVNNDPVRYTDLSGHKPCWATAKYSCSLNQKIVNQEYAKYSDEDRPAVAAFLLSQGFVVISSAQNNLQAGRYTFGSAKDDCKGLGCVVSEDYSNDSAMSTDPSTVAPEVEGKPDWRKIFLGVGIIVTVDVLVVTPIVVGLAYPPAGAIEATMLVTEPGWLMWLGGAIVGANAYGIKLIVEGTQGQ